MNKGKPSVHPMPASRLVLSLSGVIFINELLIMWVLSTQPPLPVWGQALLDSLLLSILVSPVLYFLVFRPLMRQTTDNQRVEAALRESENRFRTLFENSRDAIMTLEPPAWKFTSGNPATVKMFEARNEEHLVTLGPWEVSPERQPDGRASGEKAKEMIETALRDGSHFFEWTHQRLNGEAFPATVLLSRMELPGKVFLQATVRDITENQRTEETLAKERLLLRTLVDLLLISIYVKDTATRKILLNPQDVRRLGVATEAEALGKTDFDFYPAEEAKKYYADDQQVLQSGQPVLNREETLTLPDGSQLWVLTSKVPLRDAAGRVTGLIGIGLDVTERKQVEENLRAAKEAAEQAARAKAEFLACMSHEIRTPMNGVIGMTGLLLDTELSAEQREFANTIRASADSLLTIINDILDFSKIESGKLTLEALDFDLRDVVEDTLELLAERAQAKGLELTGSLPPEMPTQLRGDAGRLRQILTNLAGNAIKFTERGEVVVRVVRESETPTHVRLRFEVKDTGLGITPEAQGRLFQAFSQADSSTTRKFGGTGLGLAISRQLVELMQGQIGVTSEVGKGSTFWFTVPWEKQSPDAKPPAKYSRDLYDLRVLVVDDNATNRQILRHQIFAWKMQKGSAASGREALDLLRSAAATGAPYGLALLDMQMPEMDGLTLARAIKADPAIARTKLMILTSLGQRPEAAELQAAGIEAYLVKPVKQSRLFDALVEVMGKAEAEAATQNAPPLSPSSASTITAPQWPVHKTRILLAEDNCINQKVALGQLRKLGYTADAVANGLEVLEALWQVPYDVVLMDCQMPEMDGYQAAREIRRREKLEGRKPIPIIAMTANAMQGDREKCLAAGMDDYVSKPVRTAELQAALERWAAAKPAGTNPTAPEQGGLEPKDAAGPEEPPVDRERLREITDHDAQAEREMVDLYLTQADELLGRLHTALQAGSAPDVQQLAHKLGGASSSCGMMGIVPPLRELEHLARAGRLPENEALEAEARRQLGRIRQFLAAHAQSSEAF